MVAATDYMKLYADQIRPFVADPYLLLGTMLGRSDVRTQLRHFFEVDHRYVVWPR